MAGKINVKVPFKISHKASPCRGGHFPGDIFFKIFCLFFSFFKKRRGTKKRDHTPSGIRNQISSLFRLQLFSSSAKTSGWRAICGDVGPNAHSAGQPRRSSLNVGRKIWRGQKDFEIKGYWNPGRRFKGPTMPKRVEVAADGVGGPLGVSKGDYWCFMKVFQFPFAVLFYFIFFYFLTKGGGGQNHHKSLVIAWFMISITTCYYWYHYYSLKHI